MRDPPAGILLPAGEFTLKNGKNTSHNKKKKKGLSQKNRIKAAYLLLTSIILFVVLLLIVIPGQKSEQEYGTEEEAYLREGTQEAEETDEERPFEQEPAEEISKEERSTEEKPTEEELTEEELTEEEPAEKGEPLTEQRPPPKYLYLVIDDVGYSLDQLDIFLELPVPITFAVLPRIEHTETAYRRIIESGREVILHQPIEPVGDQNPGPGALYVDMRPEDIQRTVRDNLAQLPDAVGMNNHMGSRGTADSVLMKSTLEQMQRMDPKLFFLDSRTTSESVAEQVAESLRLPNSRRNVFLDNESNRDAIEAALEEALTTADEQGYVVMIGHVWCAELAATLALWYSEIEERGYEFAYMSSHFSEEVAHACAGN